MAAGKNQSSSKQRPPKILLAKPGIDGHDRGVLVLARAFRDAGMEVLYAGLLPTPEEVIDTAVNEDVDVIAMSLLNGAHLTVFKRVADLMKERGIDDIALAMLENLFSLTPDTKSAIFVSILPHLLFSCFGSSFPDMFNNCG